MREIPDKKQFDLKMTLMLKVAVRVLIFTVVVSTLLWMWFQNFTPVSLKSNITLSILPFVLQTPFWFFLQTESFFTGTSYEKLQTFCWTLIGTGVGISLIHLKTFALSWCRMLMLFCSVACVLFISFWEVEFHYW